MAASTTTNTTTRTITKETRSTLHDDDGDQLPPYLPSPTAYKAQMTPRHLVINRTTSYGPNSGGGSKRSVSMERSMAYGSSLAAPSGAYAVVTSTGVSAVKQSRDREKKDMQDLNERFAGYIEKVRFLEAQNRRLADELEKLKGKWGKETMQVKSMYQAELDEARKLLDDAEKEKARLEIRVASLEEQLQDQKMRLDDAVKSAVDSREKIDLQNQQLADFEGEISLLRRRLEALEADKDKDKKLNVQLQDALNRARMDLDNETLLHIDAENRRQTLEEEIEFLKSVHEQEMKELSALAYRDTTAENREFWKNEMGQALREIQQIYDEKLDIMKGELETFYNLKIQEFRTGSTRQNMEATHAKEESKRLRTQLTELREKLGDLDARNQQLQRELDALRRDSEDRERELERENSELKIDVAKLRAEMEAILKELQDIMDTKLGLELEIAAYRKLLEGEETRVGLRQAVDSSWGAGGGSSGKNEDATARKRGDNANAEQPATPAGKQSVQKTAKGPISITESSPDGTFIVIENTGRTNETLDGWKITRTIDGEELEDFAFEQLSLKPGTRSKIWAEGCKPGNAPLTDIESTHESWGVGGNIVTKLVNPNGDERATHMQKSNA